MPPKFMESGFLFTDGEHVPDHHEVFASEAERDTGKWYLQGLDTFSDETYSVAIDIDTEEEAEFLATARLRYLEVKQPTIESGGQDRDGIQDQVFVVPPGSAIGGRFNPPRSELFGNSPERPEN